MPDYIDRQEALNTLCDNCDTVQAVCPHYPCKRYTSIEALPSADVQPVHHGKWIKAQRKGITSYGDGFAECDKCHEVSWLGWNDKYCRNCGARMDGAT